MPLSVLTTFAKCWVKLGEATGRNYKTFYSCN
jgi:hypothetical protein